GGDRLRVRGVTGGVRGHRVPGPPGPADRAGHHLPAHQPPRGGESRDGPRRVRRPRPAHRHRHGRGRTAARRQRGDVLMLLVTDLTVRFGDTVAVDDVTLELPRGQVLAVLGPSGCGKSTLLRAIAGLEHLDDGSVSVGGQDLAGVPTHRRGFALMFQDGQLFQHLTVGQNIAYPLRLRGTPASRRRSRVTELLELVGLPGYADRRPATLSGGEQQRVALARSLAAEPRLLLLDEPLSALDRSLRERLAADLREILVATGTTALFVTHDHDEAFTIADQVAVMFRGRVVQQGPTLEVWRSPVDE